MKPALVAAGVAFGALFLVNAIHGSNVTDDWSIADTAVFYGTIMLATHLIGKA